jgi:outer membrane protein assembly factor BamB
MSYFWKKALLACGFATIIIMPSCKKESSGDDPLPITYDPSVIIASDNQFVYAYDPKTGRKHWELFLNTPIEASPLLVDTCVYIAGMDGNLYKIDAKRGTLLKTLKDFPGSQFKGTPIVYEKLIYLPSTNDTLYCLDNDVIKWKFNATADIVCSPTITPDKHVLFASTNGKLFCADALSGVPHWQYEPTPTTSFVSSPVASGKFIFIGALDNNMYAIRNDTTIPVTKWIFPTGYPISSSPVIHGGGCIFGSDDFKLYYVDTAKGLNKWPLPFQTGDRIQSSPFAKDNVIYVGSYDQHMYAINTLDGKLKWKYKTYGLIKSSPVLYDGILYFGSDDKFVYALDPTVGKPRWVQNIGGLIHCSPMVDDLSGKSYNSSVSGMPTQ